MWKWLPWLTVCEDLSECVALFRVEPRHLRPDGLGVPSTPIIHL